MSTHYRPVYWLLMALIRPELKPFTRPGSLPPHQSKKKSSKSLPKNRVISPVAHNTTVSVLDYGTKALKSAHIQSKTITPIVIYITPASISSICILCIYSEVLYEASFYPQYYIHNTSPVLYESYHPSPVIYRMLTLCPNRSLCWPKSPLSAQQCPISPGQTCLIAPHQTSPITLVQTCLIKSDQTALITAT